MRHDDYENCKRHNRDDVVENIMSHMLQNNTKPWQWSKCSRHFLTEFLE